MQHSNFSETFNVNGKINLVVYELKVHSNFFHLNGLFNEVERKMESMESDLKDILDMLEVSLDEAKNGDFKHLDFVIKCSGWTLESIVEIIEPMSVIQECGLYMKKQLMEQKMKPLLNEAKKYAEEAASLSSYASIMKRTVTAEFWNNLSLEAAAKSKTLLQKAHECTL
jgi:hypothetical protein